MNKTEHPLHQLESLLEDQIDTLREEIDTIKKELSRKERELKEKELYRELVVNGKNQPKNDFANSTANESVESKEIAPDSNLPFKKKAKSYEILKREKKVLNYMSKHEGPVHVSSMSQDLGINKHTLASWLPRLAEDPSLGIKKEPNVSAYVFTKPKQVNLIRY